MSFKSLIKKIFFNEVELVKVYSHPRSGTHFLEAFIARNFYKGKNLSLKRVIWGHWSNREVNPKGNPYGKLFGNHYFAESNLNDLSKVYIIRDGRAVAFSVWKTRNFVHKDSSDMSFKSFLRTPIDWYGTPSKRVEPTQTILEHWAAHVNSWQELAKKDQNLLLVNYEDLKTNPYEVYLMIRDKFFKDQPKLSKNEVDFISKPVGLLPNQATTDAWKSMFDEEDNELFNAITLNT